MIWRPKPGDLVGVKKLGLVGIVLECSDPVKATGFFSRGHDGMCLVLLGEERARHTWSALYPIRSDDEDGE